MPVVLCIAALMGCIIYAITGNNMLCTTWAGEFCLNFLLRSKLYSAPTYS